MVIYIEIGKHLRWGVSVHIRRRVYLLHRAVGQYFITPPSIGFKMEGDLDITDLTFSDTWRDQDNRKALK